MLPARPLGERDKRGEFHLYHVDSSRVGRQPAVVARIGPFEGHPTEYEEWFEKNHFAYYSELQAVREQLPKSGEGLEIGVGTGRFAAPLRVEFGVEPSSRMREIAKHRGIEVVGGVAEGLPFADAQFDFVLMVTTVCFLDDVDAAFRETRRVLRRTGRFVVGFVDSDSPLGMLYEKNKGDSKFYRIATFYSVDEIVSHLKRAGFGHFNIVQTIFHPLNEIGKVEPVVNGYGKGSFVVITAGKED